MWCTVKDNQAVNLSTFGQLANTSQVELFREANCICHNSICIKLLEHVLELETHHWFAYLIIRWADSIFHNADLCFSWATNHRKVSVQDFKNNIVKKNQLLYWLTFGARHACIWFLCSFVFVGLHHLWSLSLLPVSKTHVLYPTTSHPAPKLYSLKSELELVSQVRTSGTKHRLLRQSRHMLFPVVLGTLQNTSIPDHSINTHS